MVAVASTHQNLSPEEVEALAEAEGLTIILAPPGSSTEYAGVVYAPKSDSGGEKTNKYKATLRAKRGSSSDASLMSRKHNAPLRCLGRFASPHEAALAIARDLGPETSAAIGAKSATTPFGTGVPCWTSTPVQCFGGHQSRLNKERKLARWELEEQDEEFDEETLALEAAPARAKRRRLTLQHKQAAEEPGEPSDTPLPNLMLECVQVVDVAVVDDEDAAAAEDGSVVVVAAVVSD